MITLFKVFMSEEAIALASETLRSGYVAQGPKVDLLEQRLRDYLGTNNVVTLNSCTSALHLAYHLIKTEHNLPDDTEVLCTPVTCWATNMTVLNNNMRIKWCDICPESMNISLTDVIDKLSPKTRILSFVHWGGYPVNPYLIKQIKEKYKAEYKQELFVVEDAAHAFGSKYDGQMLGAIDPDNYVTFSFQAIKALTSGDGGVLITPNNTYKKARLKRWFGLDRDNNKSFRHCADIEHLGFKFHMCDVMAAVALGNLPHIDANLAKHKANALYYHQHIQNPLVQKVKPNNDFNNSCWWLYTLIVDDSKKFIEYMKDRGIEANPIHTRNDNFTLVKDFKSVEPLKNVDYLENKRVCIPVGWHVSERERNYIVDSINEYI